MELDDEYDRLSNLCADVVSERRWEPALLRLLRDTPSAEWRPLRELTDSDDYPATLAASWVKAPNADSAIVLFFDTETLWSMHADYNLGRLVRTHSIIAKACA